MRKEAHRKTDNDLRWLAYRVKVLPVQLERAYARVRQLETEAASLGMGDILHPPHVGLLISDVKGAA